MVKFRWRPAGPRMLVLLAFSAWLLLLISWVMSAYAFSRLPQTVAAWSSLWRGGAGWEAKSVSFFVYPLVQTFLFLSLLFSARAVLFRVSTPELKTEPPGRRKDARLLELKKEILYLGLIFLNLVFIHLQTTLILVSHGLANGINRFYFGMLLLVIVLLFPYYRIRRRMLRS